MSSQVRRSARIRRAGIEPQHINTIICTLGLNAEQGELLTQMLADGELSAQPPVEGEASSQARGASEQTVFDRSQPGEPSARQHEELAGQERYRLMGVLGTGGMGKVYQVQDNVLQRVVAMKIIHDYMIHKPVLVARFFEEAQIGAQLQHPNIIPVYDIGRLPNGQHYFTMKQIEGRSFTSMIRDIHHEEDEHRWAPSVDKVSCYSLIQIFHKLALAVAYAHDQGVIHRDLKPDNVMLGEYGEIVLFDWGIAKVVGGVQMHHEPIETERTGKRDLQTHVGSVAGTPNYMAPEQVVGDVSRVGFVSDVYSLGAILYEVLTGFPPFYGLSAQQIFSRAPSGPPGTLRPQLAQQAAAHVGGVRSSVATTLLPESLIDICERAMAVDIAVRYASAHLLADAVHNWMQGVEQRERALRIVESARRSKAQALEQQSSSKVLWLQAQLHMEHEGVRSTVAHSRWMRAREEARLAAQFDQRYLQQMLGALAYVPHLVEAHRELAQRCQEEVLQATACGERQDAAEHSRQLALHLKHLPLQEQDRLRAELKRGLQDRVRMHRLRRGPLIGRQGFLEQATKQLRSGVRLLSLIGIAGVGKTAAALELHDALRGDFSRVIFCELTTAQDRQDVLRLVADALQVVLRDRDAEVTLRRVLQVSKTLLILDITDHLSEAVRVLCRAWLEQAPDLQIVVASRGPLGLPEETVAKLQPLHRLASIELFVNRAQFTGEGIVLEAERWEQVSALVDQLDRLPLAIELAAARLNILSLEELSEGLGERLGRLRSRDGLALSASLDCSWDYLDAQSQLVLAQLSHFRGGFTLEAADAVVSLVDQPERAPLYEHLELLLDNRLLQREHTSAGVLRYRLLESIRAYAALQLQEAGIASEVQRRHAEYYARFGDMRRMERQRQDIHLELDNFIVGISAGDPETAPKCCLAALQVLNISGPMSQGLVLCAQALSLQGLSVQMRALVEICQCAFLRMTEQLQAAWQLIQQVGKDVAELEDSERLLLEGVLLLERGRIFLEREELHLAQDCLQDALAMLTLNADVFGEVDALNLLGLVTSNLGDHDTARTYYIQALARSRSMTDRQREGTVLGNLANLESESGNVDAGRSHYLAALKIVKANDDHQMHAQLLGRLGDLEHGEGNTREARSHYNEAIQLAQERGMRASEAIFRGNLGNLERADGHYAQAEVLYQEAIRSSRACGDKHAEALFTEKMGLLAQMRGDLDVSESLFVSALELVQSLGNKRSEALLTCSLGNLARARGEQDAAHACYTDAIALARANDNCDIEGVALSYLGELLIDVNQLEEGVQTLRQGIALCDPSVPHLAGVFKASLALALVQGASSEESLQLLAEGEPQVQHSTEAHIMFLCRQVHVLHHVGDLSSARQALMTARRCSERLQLPTGSELTRRIDEAVKRLATVDRGHK